MKTHYFCITATLLLASCSSGGESAPRDLGDAPPFAASSDIGATHPWALRRWIGTAQSDAGGPPGYLSVRISGWPQQVPPPWSGVPCAVVGDLNLAGQGECQAGGDRLFLRAQLAQASRCTLLLTASGDRQALSGRYEVFLGNATAPTDRGSVSLAVEPATVLRAHLIHAADGAALYILREATAPAAQD